MTFKRDMDDNEKLTHQIENKKSTIDIEMAIVK
jgi:hypothetical protein